MRKETLLQPLRGFLVATFLAVGPAVTPADAVLEVVLDTNGSGTQTISDVDADGVVDFNTTVGGVLLAQARAKEAVEGINSKITLTPLPPLTDGIFRNISGSSQTFTVTVKSTAVPGTVGPPIGWDLFYRAAVADIVDFVVDVPSHSVQAVAVGGTVPLGVVAGAPLASSTPFALEEHGVDPANGTSDVWLVWTFTLGPNDEMRVPFDGGFDEDSIQVNIFNNSQKCVERMNNGARRIADRSQKSDAKCVKTSSGLATACVDAPAERKTLSAQQSLLDDFIAQCNPVPAWGVEATSCCTGGGPNDGDPCTDSSTCGGAECRAGGCMAEIPELGMNELTHDLYGAAVAVSPESKTRKCQYSVSRAVGKLYMEHWKGLRLCKRDEFAAILNDADLKAQCLEPEPDPKGKLQKRTAKLGAVVQSRCFNKSVTGLGSVFPGACAGEPDISMKECLAEQTACRFCRAANIVDAILPPVDCELFDDGLANGTCPP